MTKEEIAQNEQFFLFPQCFPLLVIGYPFNYKDILLFDKICLKSSAAELSYEGKGERTFEDLNWLLKEQNPDRSGSHLVDKS